MTRTAHQRKAVERMEDKTAELIYAASSFVQGEPAIDRKIRTRGLLAAARAYAAAVNRLRRS